MSDVKYTRQKELQKHIVDVTDDLVIDIHRFHTIVQNGVGLTIVCTRNQFEAMKSQLHSADYDVQLRPPYTKVEGSNKYIYEVFVRPL